MAKKRKDIVVGEDEKGSYSGTIGVKESLKMGWWIIEADNWPMKKKGEEIGVRLFMSFIVEADERPKHENAETFDSHTR